MITEEQVKKLTQLHADKNKLTTAISYLNNMKADIHYSYRQMEVTTYNGNGRTNVKVHEFLTANEIIELRDQIVCKLNDKLEDINDELNSLILSKEV